MKKEKKGELDYTKVDGRLLHQLGEADSEGRITVFVTTRPLRSRERAVLRKLGINVGNDRSRITFTGNIPVEEIGPLSRRVWVERLRGSTRLHPVMKNGG